MSHIIKKEGFSFAFDQNACFRCNGACCRGESGYVWVDREEIERISDFLQIPSKQFVKDFLKKEGYRYSLKEIKKDGEFFCIFFDNGCQIYPVRPKQCKAFPFWDRYKDRKNLGEVCKECPGIVLLD